MYKSDFVQGIAQLLFYQTQNGNLDVPEDYVTADKFPLGAFVRDIRTCYQNGLLSEDQERQLDDIGFSADETLQTWMCLYRLTREYTHHNGGKIPGATERTADNALIGAWVRKQRLMFYALSPEQRLRLEGIGIYAAY